MRRRRLGWLLVALVAGCALQTGVKPNTGPTRRATTSNVQAVKNPSPPASASATAMPTSSPSDVVSDSRKQLLIQAIHDLLAASRASQVTSTLGQASGIISNNGSGLLSDKGLGLIGKVKSYEVADASDTQSASDTQAASDASQAILPDATATPEVDIVEANSLVYVITDTSDTTGEFKTYDKTAYHTLPAAQLDQALVDDFKWTDVTLTQNYGGDPLKVSAAYHLKKVSSKRLNFLDTLLCTEILALTPTDTGVDSKVVGWDITFGMDVPLLGTTVDHADFEAKAGPDDIAYFPVSDGSQQAMPAHLTLTGSNKTGQYDGQMDNKTDGAVSTSVSYTGSDGKKTELVLTENQDGSLHKEITCDAANLRVVLDLDPQLKGQGQILDVTSATPQQVGTVSWDTTGVGTLTFDDGTTAQARVF